MKAVFGTTKRTIACNAFSLTTIVLRVITSYSIHYTKLYDINCIYEDYLQNLWIGTNDGLARYIREYDRFENYFPGSDSNALRGELVSQLLEDQDSVLWIVTSGGICRYNRQQDNFSSFADIPMNDPLFQYTSMAQDLQGRYWVVSTRNGIYEFVPSRRAFIP